jgi:6-phosphogluconate dehydrogenase
LVLDPELAQILSQNQADMRSVVSSAMQLGIAVPGFMSAVGYYDAYRSPRLPANLIQAQRDYFGAHTYERIDQPGTFHTQWVKA